MFTQGRPERPSDPEESEFQEQTSGMSRRDFLKFLAKGAAVAGVMAAGIELTGCVEDQPWKQEALTELQPELDSEKKMYEVLKDYTDVQGKTGTDTLQAAILTQPIASGKKSSGDVAEVYKGMKSDYSASSDDAALLAAAAGDLQVNGTVVGEYYKTARSLAPSHNENPVNVAVIAAYTHQGVEEVIKYDDVAKASYKPSLVPIMALGEMGGDKVNNPEVMLGEIRAAGITDERDTASLLYARTFSNAPLAELLTIMKELGGIPEVKPEAKGDLLMAAVFNDLDLESVLEAYNFAGTLQGVNTESAAKLTLAMFEGKAPTLDDTTSNPRSTYNGGHVFLYHGYGGYYGGYGYGYYPRTGSAFVPTSRGSSFSSPGKAPVRGGGFTGGAATSGRGGIGGRAGGGTA